MCECIADSHFKIKCVIVLYFLPTSLFTEWVCVYAYTEPLGQHAGISELFLFIYLIFSYTFPSVINKGLLYPHVYFSPGAMVM